jgi:hypothetical protein
MKKALIIETTSSASNFKNGGTIRQNTVESILKSKGYEIYFLKSTFNPEEMEWDVIVIFSVRRVHLAKQISSTKTKIWLDLCDSWIYSRLSLWTGPRLLLIGFYELIIILRRRNSISKCQITYISGLDRDLDGNLLKFLGVKSVFTFNNIWNTTDITLNQSNKKRLVFTGNGNYFPNFLAVLELSLLSLFHMKRQKIKTHIDVYGSNWSNWINFLPNIHIRGFAPEADMYFAGDIHLVPLRQKAGIKNKIMVPLSLGLPVLAYKQCMNGIPNWPNFYPCNSRSDFSSKLKQLFYEESFWPEKISEYLSPNEVDSNFSNWLNS